MKVRWREHEMITVIISIISQLLIIPIRIGDSSIKNISPHLVTAFNENNIIFNYRLNVLLPSLCSPLLILSVYFLINLFILPTFKKISLEDLKKLISIDIAIAVFSLLFVGYFLAIGINVLSFYARPDLVGYNGYEFLSLTGHNNEPLTNIFFGFGRSLLIVTIFTTLVLVRDYIIGWIERPGSKREYRILTANSTTPLLVVYTIIPFIINPTHDDFLRYLVFATPLLILYTYVTFWLFPTRGDRSFLDKPIYMRLLIATFLCTIPSIFLYLRHIKPYVPAVYWIVLLFIATPVFWMIYQQRKDKIQQLRNMETALADSDATLQFLKSQINPHFLFNALNALYGTALKGENEKTAEGIQKLGDMMRFMLHENMLDLITVEKEVGYLTNFISLQKLRIQSSGNVSIDDSIEECADERQIAPMLLIPFVENAFKHGVCGKEKSWIKIRLTIKDTSLWFEVSNSIHKKEHTLESGKSGVGLANVKKRLKLLYPDTHSLDIIETETEFNVKLALLC